MNIKSYLNIFLKMPPKNKNPLQGLLFWGGVFINREKGLFLGLYYGIPKDSDDYLMGL